MNGKVERWNRTQGGLIRASLVGVDRRVWDHCSRFVSYVYNRTERRTLGKKSPYFMKNGREPSKHHWKRFGCLAYSKIHTNIPHDADRFERGIFLGYHEVNSTYLIGVWRSDNRTRAGHRFTVLEQKTAKFDESILVSNVDHLRPSSQGTYVPFSLPEQLTLSEVPDEPVDVGPDLQPGNRAPGANVKTPVLTPETSPAPPKVDEGGSNTTGSSPADSVPVPPEETDVHDDRVVVEGEVKKKKRGRPKGSKNRPGSLKPGPKPKEPSRNFLAHPVASVFLAETFVARKLKDRKFVDKIDEEQCGFTIQVSRTEALHGPDSIKWMEADSLERLKLEALRCWRPLEDADMKPGVQCIPSTVVYTRKRCGRFKARLIALGNLQKCFGESEIASPTVSYAANRALLIESAHLGHVIRQCDVSTAFINAEIPSDEHIHIRLPKHWSKDPAGDRVKLLRSLYGLRCAPRRWFDCIRAHLESNGWRMVPREPGLFSKPSPSGRGTLLCALYVDDALMSGEVAEEVEHEMNNTILNRFKGSVVDANEVLGDGTEVRDLLGSRLEYNARKKYMSITMPDAIDRLLKKFHMEGCTPQKVPCVSPAAQTAEGLDRENTIFPIRACVGSLLFVAGQCRPDISFAVGRIAQQVTRCTDQTVKDAKRVLAYLKGTKEKGIVYCPASEKKFNDMYQKIAQDAGKSLPNTVCFSDSDFAGCSFTMKSTSGSILFRRGTPCAWSSRKQGVTATSTCQAEYVAAFDSIQLVQGQGYLDYFMEEGESPLYFIDNQAALGLASTSIIGKKSKHINLRYHVVREYSKDLAYCPTDINRADPLTKALPSMKYMEFFLCYELASAPRST